MRRADHRASLAAALAAIEIHPDGDYSWLGERFGGGNPRLLAWRLAHRLYVDYYVRGEAAPAIDRSMASVAVARPDLLPALEAANRGAGCLDPGWRLREADGARWRVERDDVSLWVTPEAVATESETPASGHAVCVRLPKGLTAFSPGYYTALGDRGVDPDSPGLRIYLSLTPDGAAPAMDLVTSELNAARTPFVFKVLTDSTTFARCDAGVLLVKRIDEWRAVALARDLADSRPWALKERTPALTEAVARGVGIAEDPPGPGSFGTHRCRLIADAVCGVWSAGRPTLEGVFAAVEDRLASAGVGLDAPHRIRSAVEAGAA